MKKHSIARAIGASLHHPLTRYMAATGLMAFAIAPELDAPALEKLPEAQRGWRLRHVGSVASLLRGGNEALKHLCEKLSIEPGQTTKDGLITLQPAECMGACADAPVLLVNDRSMCSYMSDDKLDQLIDGLRAAAKEQS
jgi:hypothetical protein